jgi:hypothetical protein
LPKKVKISLCESFVQKSYSVVRPTYSKQKVDQINAPIHNQFKQQSESKTKEIIKIHCHQKSRKKKIGSYVVWDYNLFYCQSRKLSQFEWIYFRYTKIAFLKTNLFFPSPIHSMI